MNNFNKYLKKTKQNINESSQDIKKLENFRDIDRIFESLITEYFDFYHLRGRFEDFKIDKKVHEKKIIELHELIYNSIESYREAKEKMEQI